MLLAALPAFVMILGLVLLASGDRHQTVGGSMFLVGLALTVWFLSPVVARALG